MLTRIRRPDGRHCRRRGVTLVEMLVVVALLVLMMTILVQIFQQATGAISISRTTADLDVNLRQLDSIIRSDLAGTTAKMTPPNDPKDKRGYFEYGENARADAQGEDTDDYMAFTTKAAEGEVFTGRQWLPPPANQGIQPATITSQVAEVIYFLRNGNLYRRVFLVVPDRAKTIGGSGTSGNYTTNLFGGLVGVSWLGMNDISCRPQDNGQIGVQVPVPNDLGTLTNRENRAFRPRFVNDIVTPRDGKPDDNNGDGVPDYYPTLYFDGAGYGPNDANGNPIWSPNRASNEALGYATMPVNLERANYDSAVRATGTYAFPFIYPGMYSVPDATRLPGAKGAPASGLGWIHGTVPTSNTINHSPLLVADNLASPGNQTWWGFPTWRETMAGASGTKSGWLDPYATPTYLPFHVQANGLTPYLATTLPTSTDITLLPPVYLPGTATPASFFDGAGSASFVAYPSATTTVSANPNPIWEDDLLQTNVRSFDIKAYDSNAPLYSTTQNGYFAAGYQDLGYGSSYFDASADTSNPSVGYNYVGGPNGIAASPGNSAATTPQPYTALWQAINGEPVGFGHEGRIPPLTADFRLHPRRPTYTYYDNMGNLQTGYHNLGDDTAAVQRLVRVWDSWSTDYSNAPDYDIFLNQIDPSTRAIYPSFPAPYPSALRGIQIQIRVADPRNERVKSITIRHDFTDKL